MTPIIDIYSSDKIVLLRGWGNVTKPCYPDTQTTVYRKCCASSHIIWNKRTIGQYLPYNNDSTIYIVQWLPTRNLLCLDVRRTAGLSIKTATRVSGFYKVATQFTNKLNSVRMTVTRFRFMNILYYKRDFF